jgi:cysteinyl-tRNA synthetase
VTATNIYLSQPPADIKIPLVRSVSRFIFHILKCFGLYDDGDYPAVSGDAGGASYEDSITPLMNVLLKFRDDVKKNAGSQANKELLMLSDQLRDDILPALGIRLEDKGKDAPSIWKYEDKETLMKERAAKLAEKEAKEIAKRERAELDLKKKSTPGKDWFRVMEADKYSKFNEETGLPTHDAKGKALSEAPAEGDKKEEEKA